MSKVLWLSNETPDQGGQGGQRRQFFQIRELARAGHRITVCCLSGSQEDLGLRAHADVVRTRTHWRGRVPRVAHQRLLRQLAAQEWGAVVLAHTESWPTFEGLIQAVPAPSWVDLHNVLGMDVSSRRTEWADVEHQICVKAAIVSVCSEAEQSRLLDQQPHPDAHLTVMPHGIDPGEWQAPRRPSEQPVVKLFGNWAWGPNRRGLEWFLSQVWPRLETTTARCLIAGSGADIPAGCRDSVTFVGRVPSLDVWTSDAWAVAVPVVGGVGAPVKYLEAVATHAPVLSTPDGAPTARHAAALVSADPQAWTSTLDALLGQSSPPPDTHVDLQELSWKKATAPLLRWLAER